MLCDREAKAEAQEIRPFTNDSVYQRLPWFLAVILYGSLRAPLKISPLFTLGLPPRERSVGSKDTLTHLPSISSTQRLAEKLQG